MSIARDGTGTLVYRKNVGGVAHVFATSLVNGTWTAPERLDPGLGAPATQVVVAAGQGGQSLVAFVDGGELYTVSRPPGGAFTAPVALAAGASDPAIALEPVRGKGYLVFASQGSLRLAYRSPSAGTWQIAAAPLDAQPGRGAGTYGGHAAVAASADGNALVAWGEAGTVFVRRVRGTRLGKAVLPASVASYAGHPDGAADSPGIAVQYSDGYGTVVFREDFAGIGSRVLARRLTGATFQAPVDVDGLGAGASEGADHPQIALDGGGTGLIVAARQSSHAVVGVRAHRSTPEAPMAVSQLAVPGPPDPAVAVGAHAAGIVAWQNGGTIVARPYDGRTLQGPDTPISAPGLMWPPDAYTGLVAGADNYRDAAVAFTQGLPIARSLIVAMLDAPPTAVRGSTTRRYQHTSQPTLRWSGGNDVWGGATYTIRIDGKPVGTATAKSFTPPQSVPDGMHSWSVVATDRHGQQVTSTPRALRIDTVAPTATVSIARRGRAGHPSTLQVGGADVGSPPAASGLRRIDVRFGDGKRLRLHKPGTVSHTYATPGRYAVRVRVSDRAGNRTTATQTLRVRAPRRRHPGGHGAHRAGGRHPGGH